MFQAQEVEAATNRLHMTQCPFWMQTNGCELIINKPCDFARGAGFGVRFGKAQQSFLQHMAIDVVALHRTPSRDTASFRRKTESFVANNL